MKTGLIHVHWLYKFQNILVIIRNIFDYKDFAQYIVKFNQYQYMNIIFQIVLNLKSKEKSTQKMATAKNFRNPFSWENFRWCSLTYWCRINIGRNLHPLQSLSIVPSDIVTFDAIVVFLRRKPADSCGILSRTDSIKRFFTKLQTIWVASSLFVRAKC